MNHFYFDIPGWFGFHDVYDRAIALLGKDGAHFVEVGCWEGRSAAYMGVGIVNSGFKIRFDCVDTWEGSAEHTDATEKAELYDKFVDNMARFESKHDYRVIRKESTLAACDYADGSLDFVFLDASHDADSVYADVNAWKPKLKPTGVLAGDDCAFVGVREGLMKAGVGTPDNPVTISGGTYKSWMLVPKRMQDGWKTPVPKQGNVAAVEGGIEVASETIKGLIPPDAPPGCIAGHEEEFRERMKSLGRIA